MYTAEKYPVIRGIPIGVEPVRKIQEQKLFICPDV